ncbi:MAG TPA: outer membrane beta-barrel protein [Steroidobacteraceae bacterium]
MLGSAALLHALGAGAANWEVAPRVEAGYRYNDNYRLDLPGGELEVSGMEADAEVTFRTVDPRTRVEISPRIQATYFPDESDEDSTDYFLGALIADETPRRRVGILGDFSEEDVVRSELPTAEVGGDLGDPQAVDSGRIVERNRRTYMRVEPYFGYDLSQRHSIEARVHYLQADFDTQLLNAQQDFSELGAEAGFGFRVSERSSLMVRALASQYETTFKTDAYGGMLEWNNDFSPTSRMYIRLGAQRTEPERRQSDTNVIAGIGGRWTSPRNTLFLDLTRTVGPVAAGTIVERHQLRLRIDHDISPRLALLLGARASRDEEIDEAGTYPTREYVTAEAGLEWRVARSFALTAVYNYRWQEYEDEPSDASANGFLIGVVYEPRRQD